MVLQLQDIDPSRDFPSLARCLFESHESPKQPFFFVFFPTHAPGDATAREAAMAECAARLQRWHADDATSVWKKVVDTDMAVLAGASLWHVFDEDPFAAKRAEDVTWFPDDGSRTFAEKALERHEEPRSRAAQRPHLYLHMAFTHPNYRRRGVAQLYLDWGMNKADELGYECFLESTPYGRPLYEKNGFVHVEEYVNHPQTDSPDKAWKEMDERVGPFTFWLMWRPAGGKYEEGKTIKPWEEHINGTR